MLCIYMQMFILFVSLTIWTNVVYFHADVYTFCFINNMECCVFSCRCLYFLLVECCVFSCRCLYFLCHYQYGRMLCIFMQMFILFVPLTIGWMFCIFMQMFILIVDECCVFCRSCRCLYFFVSLTIWTNVVYFHADVYTFCVNNNMVECCVFSCRCLYFLCH